LMFTEPVLSFLAIVLASSKSFENTDDDNP
jgi:hypothetical protein